MEWMRGIRENKLYLILLHIITLRRKRSTAVSRIMLMSC